MKATELSKAADDARRLLRGFQAFAEVGAALDAAAQSVQAAEEAQKLLADLQPQVQAAQAEIAEAKAEAKKLREQGKAKLDEAEQQAAERVKTAEAKAADILAEARETADAVLVQAKGDLQTAQMDAAVALEQRDAARTELAELQAKITQARAQVQQVLGATLQVHDSVIAQEAPHG